jgi:hypothetical protein
MLGNVKKLRILTGIKWAQVYFRQNIYLCAFKKQDNDFS